MPSTVKTPNIGLNQWSGNEYFKRQDFVEDNFKIDEEIKKLIDSIGDLRALDTEAKLSLVAAINEVLTKLGSIKLEADNVTIKDLENLFTSDKVEGALKEAMTKANNNAKSIQGIKDSVSSSTNSTSTTDIANSYAVKQVMDKAEANETSISTHTSRLTNIENELNGQRTLLIQNVNSTVDLIE